MNNKGIVLEIPHSASDVLLRALPENDIVVVISNSLRYARPSFAKRDSCVLRSGITVRKLVILNGAQ